LTEKIAPRHRRPVLCRSGSPAPETVPGVTVVLPVWNRPRLLLTALDSVSAQTLPPSRIVVVDDGSTDGTASAAAAWLERHGSGDAHRLLRTPHRGAAAARNLGLRLAPADGFVAFLDSDDTWPPDFLARTATALAANPDAVVALTDRHLIDVESGSDRIDDLSALVATPLVWMLAGGAGFGSASLIRVGALRAVRAYPEGIATGHDVRVFFRLAARGRWLHCPGAPVTFLRGHSRATGEAGHIASRHADHLLRWAETFERAVTELGPGRVPRCILRRRMARRWRQAGDDLRRRGRRAEARACYRHAFTWQPTRIRALAGWILPALGGGGRG
jgi:glycosyltransferase involved in cell wall biosynthesis